MYRSIGIEDAVDELISEGLTAPSIEQVLTEMGYSAYRELYAPASAARLLLVYSRTEYNYTSIDLEWLKYAKTAFSYETDTGDIVFFVEMTCDLDEYYVSCAAIVKLFNAAFKTNNLFVFRISKNAAFGTARDFDKKIPNNFAVTGLINRYNLYCCGELLHGLASTPIRDLPPIIISHSPPKREKKKAFTLKDPDCLSFFDDPELFDDPDAPFSNAGEFDETAAFQIIGDYDAVCEELKSVGEDGAMSSYEDLDAAQAAEEKARNARLFDVEGDDAQAGVDPAADYSKEAFCNAEQMLKEMLRKDKR